MEKPLVEWSELGREIRARLLSDPWEKLVQIQESGLADVALRHLREKGHPDEAEALEILLNERLNHPQGGVA